MAFCFYFIQVLVVLWLFVLCDGQQMISTKMKVGDELEYEIEFVPNAAGVRYIANRFCEERRGDFGMALPNMAACTEPVVEYLDSVLQRRAGETGDTARPLELTVPLKIGEDEFLITYGATEEAASEMAIRFCKEKGDTFGISESNFEEDCVQPIGDYLRRSIPSAPTDSSDDLPPPPSLLNDVEVSMKIGEKIFDLEWNSRYNTPENMANQFCLEHAKANLNIPVEDCIAPVLNHLLKAATPIDLRGPRGGGTVQERPSRDAGVAKTEPQLVKAKINIGGVEYEFRYEPTREDATKKADKFCRETGPSLGVEEDTIQQQCIRPIIDTLMDAIMLLSHEEANE
jgi:hypothetical protein